MVTVVTEGIFSYCSFKVKIDTDRYLGPEQATVRASRRGGRPRHHRSSTARRCCRSAACTTSPAARKKEGRVACDMMMALGNREPVELTDRRRRAAWWSRPARPPIVDGVEEQRMRVGCGSATIGIFAPQWFGHADEVVVVDDHITGVLTEHQAGKFLDMRADAASACAAASRRRAATSRSPTRARAGAAPTSPIRSRSSRARTRSTARGPACAC